MKLKIQIGIRESKCLTVIVAGCKLIDIPGNFSVDVEDRKTAHSTQGIEITLKCDSEETAMILRERLNALEVIDTEDL